MVLTADKKGVLLTLTKEEAKQIATNDSKLEQAMKAVTALRNFYDITDKHKVWVEEED